jgi:AcrR family transcriptional regulator
VDAALSIIDEEGMARLTMRGLATRLNVEPMSLYKHIENRDKLFDAVADRIVNELSDGDVPTQPVDGWKRYLTDIAIGVRGYATAHPHAFPLVATRPTEAPWVNPPLRSLNWINRFLGGLTSAGFSDDQVLFAYRTFNGFLLGFLLLETSAASIQHPLPGDGAYAASRAEGNDEPTATDAAIPGALTPTRSRRDRHDVANAAASEPEDLIDPQGQVDETRYPDVYRLAVGLAENHFDAEFQSGLAHLIRQIEDHIRETANSS